MQEESKYGICGIRCADCDAYRAAATNDLKLKEKLSKEWSKPGFQISANEIECRGCRNTSWKMTEACDIRRCAVGYNIENCAHCRFYKCDLLMKSITDSGEPAKNLERIRKTVEAADIEKAKDLVSSSKFAYLGSVDPDGYPNVKAMFSLQTDGIKKIWFSTNASSDRTKQFLKNPKACVYYSNENQYKGLMLVGKIKVLSDRKSKEMLWRDGFERYYPEGVDDPDYVVLEFTAESGKYYPGVNFIVN